MNTCTKVFLRKKAISGGRISLYLDFYPAIRNPHTNRMSRRETLGIYIYASPKNEREKQFNASMEEKAEAIRCRRFEQLLNEQFDFLDKEKLRMDFLAYFKQKCRQKYQKWDCVLRHFTIYCKGKCTFGDLTVDFCKGFRNYLLTAQRQRNNGKGPISHNSAAGYWSTFRALLKITYQEKYIRENLNDFLEKIEWKEVKKEFLTLAEVKQLVATPCKIPVLKQAVLFSCMTGLRISDILQLSWKHIQMGQDGGYLIRLCTEKTEEETNLPISDETLALCGERSEGLVFKGLKRHMVNHPLKEWIKSAGLTRRITFHTMRHSFATLLAANGVDILTISRMLTHKSVKNTQIYAKVVDERAREASQVISLK